MKQSKQIVKRIVDLAMIVLLPLLMAEILNKLLRQAGQKREKEQSNGQIHKTMAFLIPALVCVLVVAGLNLPSQNEPWQGNSSEPPEENSTSTVQNMTSPSEPGQYRQTTVAVDSFSPNAWGLYNMHGNVSEWVWDYYGEYGTTDQTNPTGPERGTRRVYRSGGRFGQSLTAITELAPDAVMGEPLSIHYSGGSSLPDDIAAWLETNHIEWNNLFN